jgi:hypothetical protein
MRAALEQPFNQPRARMSSWSGCWPPVCGHGTSTCAAPSLAGAARAARDGATIATPVHAELPDADRVHWQPYDGQPSGSRLIRMAPWFDDGSLSVHMSARYYWQDAAEAHRVVEQFTPGASLS